MNKKELGIDLLLIFELKVLKINVIGVNEFIFWKCNIKGNRVFNFLGGIFFDFYRIKFR